MCRLLGWCALISLVACSGKDDKKSGAWSDGLLESYKGTYEIVGYEVADGSCGAGESRLTSLFDTFMEAYEFQFFGTYLVFTSCSTPASCAEISAAKDTLTLGSMNFTFEEEISVDHLRGSSASSGFRQDDMCVDREFTRHDLTRDSSGSIEIRSETYPLPDHPPDEDGYCFVELSQSERESEGQPCTGVEVVQLSPIP